MSEQFPDTLPGQRGARAGRFPLDGRRQYTLEEEEEEEADCAVVRKLEILKR